MSRNVRFVNRRSLCLTACALVFAGTAAVAQQPAQVKSPLWTHAFDLKCRKNTQPVFDKDTPAHGHEVFKDENNGNGVYIMQEGGMAVFKNFTAKAAIKMSSAPEWFHGLDLKVRRADQPKFDDKTQIISMEVFRDEHTGQWIYITEKGFIGIAAADRAARAPTPSPKAPTWSHGLDLKVRKVGEKEFTKDTKVWSVEVFRDDNTGQLIYICESGSVGIVAGDALPSDAKAKTPAWFHGLDLKVRKGNQKDFDPNTPTYGMELFRDDNTGHWIYITEKGTVAVLPGDKNAKAPTIKPREPVYNHGLDLKCRKVGEEEFGPKTRVWGIEVFRDPNTECIICLCETGVISVVSAK
jgi:hypothetical protein